MADIKRGFVLILVLFVAFRVMALLAFRPGGQVLDHSDFYWYREYAQLTRQGYIPYSNLWSQYPPLFVFLMVGLWKISALLPPWEFPSLWFSLLLGGVFLLFETGNLALICLSAANSATSKALRSAWFYFYFFTLVYTPRWFESYNIFLPVQPVSAAADALLSALTRHRLYDQAPPDAVAPHGARE
jgi:hypothetical protein